MSASATMAVQSNLSPRGSGKNAQLLSSLPAGFSLVELLVALVVLGLLVVGLGQGMRFGLQAWRSATQLSDTRDTFDAVDRTLRHLIAQMDPGNETEPARFAVGADRLVFLSTLPDMPGRPAQRIEARLAVDNNHRLVLRWRPFLHVHYFRPPPFTDTELLAGVARMELSFWRPGGGWANAWSDPELPPLIRIRLKLLQSTRRWPDFVAPPGLDRP